jgi:hypothetical protein
MIRSILSVAILALPIVLSAATPGRAGALVAAEAYNSDGEQVAYEWCSRSKLTSARTCAVDACEESGGENCAIAEYCDPSQWAGVIAMRRTDGTLVNTLVCERTTRAAVFVAVRKKCTAFRNDDSDTFKQCNVLTIIAPNGEATPNTTRYRWRNGGLKAD